MNSSDFIKVQNNNLALFAWYDYLIFAFMAIGSGGIGIFFGCFGTKQATTKEYLLGNKNMAVLPTIVSIMAGYLSGVALMGAPLDTYLYGGFFILTALIHIPVGFITTFVYLPVYHTLQITSIYEYLEMRFDERTRKLASFLFAVKIFAVQPVSFFIAATALSTATNTSVHIIVPVFFGLCIFYTTIGGYKTVVWTDALQFAVTYAGYAGVVIFAMYNQKEGLGNSFKVAKEGGRFDIFIMDLSFSKRDTFWSSAVGYAVGVLAYSCVCQSVIQKILCVPTLTKSRITSICYSFGITIVVLFSVLLGILMYAKYEKCDPISSKKIDKADQLLPYFVLDTTGSIPGLSGLFISGIFCTALSSLSSNLNCLSCTIYEDFLKKTLDKKNYKRTGLILRVIVMVTGITMFLMTYLVDKFKILYIVSFTIANCTLGPLLGLFTLGILFPRTRSPGVFYGAVIGFISISTVVAGSNYYKFQNLLIYPTKPLSLENCDTSHNATLSENFITNPTDMSDIFILFRLSHGWVGFTGFTITIVLGLVFSYLDRRSRNPVPKELLSPVIYPFLSKRETQNTPFVQYLSVQKALKTLNVDNEINESENRNNK